MAYPYIDAAGDDVLLSSWFFFFLLIRPPPISTLFPYTTLFRSCRERRTARRRLSLTRRLPKKTPALPGTIIASGRGRAPSSRRSAPIRRRGGSPARAAVATQDRKSTRLNSSH